MYTYKNSGDGSLSGNLGSEYGADDMKSKHTETSDTVGTNSAKLTIIAVVSGVMFISIVAVFVVRRRIKKPAESEEREDLLLHSTIKPSYVEI